MEKGQRHKTNNKSMMYRWLRFKSGISVVIHNTTPKIILALYIFIIIGVAYLTRQYINSIEITVLSNILKIMYNILISAVSVFGLIVLITKIGTPFDYNKINMGLSDIEWNNKGKVPLLVKKTKNKLNNSILFEFYNNGISKEKFVKRQSDIVPVLDMDIIDIGYRKSSRKYICITAVPLNSLPDIIYWKDEYLDKRDFNIVLGKGQLGLVTVDLAENPQWLLAGATGSGKSLLLKMILKQCLAKGGADVFIADLKGGVDFSEWYKICDIITDKNALLSKLQEMTAEIERRQKLFREIGAQKLSEYNAQGHTLKRWIFACDEVAEILDETGLSKEEKKLISEIKRYLNTILSLGRAFGIHTILASQRIDATMLSGHSRNNITYRVCGRADENLSDVILGNKSASEIIPIDEQGLFVDNYHNTFRGFLPQEI